MQQALSILIPTYNYDVYDLVNALHTQGELLKITFEIKVYDDFSPLPVKRNEELNALNYATFTKLETNIGRSAIRNQLAKEASYTTLLFLDADTEIISCHFLENYLKALTPQSQIIYGGINYQKETPSSSKILRWHYGNAREALPVSEREKAPHLRFLTLNFLIRKSVFDVLKFNEEIPNLRHEDTLFALDCKKNSIQVTHIDNPVQHNGLENSETFLRKSMESVAALHLFVKEGLIQANETVLSKKAASLKRNGIARFVLVFYKRAKPAMRANLLSKKPSLRTFDIYRLGYYLELDTKKNA
jgi:glycosyltransferase involved in cell wall biosynthesis